MTAASDKIEVLDCRGARCPRPVIELATWARQAPLGAKVEVLADDPAAATDIPAWCRMRGHEFVKAIEQDGYQMYQIQVANHLQ